MDIKFYYNRPITVQSANWVFSRPWFWHCKNCNEIMSNGMAEFDFRLHHEKHLCSKDGIRPIWGVMEKVDTEEYLYKIFAPILADNNERKGKLDRRS